MKLCSINWQTTCLASYMREIHKYYTSKSIYTMQGTRKFFLGGCLVGIRIKVAWWKKVFCIKYHHTANLNFSCHCVYFFKNCPSQFLSHCELAESVLQWTQFSYLQKPKQKPDSVLRWKNSNLFYGENLYIRVSSTEPPLGFNYVNVHNHLWNLFFMGFLCFFF